jgi:hypothetical protein
MDEANPEFVPEWDVYRDKRGVPVTITREQVRAIWHAIAVVDQVRQAEGHESLFQIWNPPGAGTNGQTPVELAKSRLLGRMLVQGRPPTKTRPPVAEGGPAWDQLPGGDPFASELDAETRERLENQLREQRACLAVYSSLMLRHSGAPRAIEAARRIREITALLHPGAP